MRNRLFFSAFILFLYAVAAYGQGVTLDSCRAWARANYPLVEQYRLMEQSVEYSLNNASRAWLPQVSLSAQATWQSDVARFPDAMNVMLAAMGTDLDGIRQDQYKLSLDVQQSLWDGGRSLAEKRVAQAQGEADKMAIDVDFYALEGRVDNLFFGILLLEEQGAQMETRMALLEDNLRYCRKMAESEMLMQSDVDAVEAEWLVASQQREQLRHSCAAYRAMLSLMTGHPLDDAQLSAPAAPSPALTPTTQPALRLIEAKIGQLEAQKSLLRTTLMPRLSAFAQGWYGYPGLNMFENMMSADWSLNAIVGVRMAWNISAFFTHDNSFDRLVNRQHQLGVQRDVLNFNTEMQRSQQSAEVERLHGVLQNDARILALRSSVRRAAETKHRNGIISTNELMRAIAEEGAAQSAYLLHQIELLKKQYELNRL